MSHFPSSVHFLLMTILFSQVLSETLQERLNQLRENPRLKLLQDHPERSDAIAGPRSLHEVGTFAGRPIRTRQQNVYIDNQGVPVPIPEDNENLPTRSRPRIRRLFDSIEFFSPIVSRS